MTRIKAPIATLALLPLIALAAHAEDPAGAESKQGEAAAANEGEAAQIETPRGDDCIYSRMVSDFEVLDNETIVVYAPSRRVPYVVQLFTPEPGLKFEHSLGFQDRNSDGRICAYGGDAIIVDGPVANRTTITSIKKVDADTLKALKVSLQEKKTHAKTTMPAQEDMKSDKAGATKPAAKPSDEKPQS